MNANEPTPTTEGITFHTLLQQLHEAMDENVNRNVNHAFNLGCVVSMLPGFVVVLLTFLLSGKNFAATLISALLVVLTIIALANILAYISRRATAEAYYRNHISPQLQTALEQHHMTMDAVYVLACQELPENSLLRHHLSRELSESEMRQSEA